MRVTTELTVVGMECANCVSAVEKSLITLPEVDAVTVDLKTGKVSVTHSEGSPTFDAFARAVDSAGFDLAPPG